MTYYALYWHRHGELKNPQQIRPVRETPKYLIFEDFRARKSDLSVVDGSGRLEVWGEKHDRERELYDSYHRARGLVRELDKRLGDIRSPTIEQMRRVVSCMQFAITSAKEAK